MYFCFILSHFRLTAQSLLWLERANEADWWTYYYTPTKLLNKVATWLCRQQNKTTGAFFDHAPVYDAKLYVSKWLLKYLVQFNK